MNSRKAAGLPMPLQTLTGCFPVGLHRVYNHSIDAKGRVIVPQPFRGCWGRGSSWASPWARMPSPSIPTRFGKGGGDADPAEPEDAAAEVFLTRFAMYSFDGCGFDSQGRVLLPAALRDLFLEDSQSVQVSGTTGMYAWSVTSRRPRSGRASTANTPMRPLPSAPSRHG